jgi:hypothetical protein
MAEKQLENKAKCVMPNCYGNDVDGIISELKNILPLELLKFLLNLDRCASGRSRNNALSNFPGFLTYLTAEFVKVLNDQAINGKQYDYNSKNGLYKDDQLIKLLEEYDRLHCAGMGIEIEELIKDYNANSIHDDIFNRYPDGLPPELYDELMKWLATNNHGNDWKHGRKDGKYNNGTVVDSNGDGLDDRGSWNNGYTSDNNNSGWNKNGNSGSGNGNLGNGDGSNNSNTGDGSTSGNDTRFNDNDSIYSSYDGNSGSGNGLSSNGDSNNGGWVNPLLNIPNNKLLNLNYERFFFKCFDPVFDVRNYIFKGMSPFISETKRKNIYDLHHKILLPIYNHYYGESSTPVCQIKIYFALTDMKTTRQYASGSSFSHHLQGRAVDFTMVGVDEYDFVRDIQAGRLTIPFGVMTVTNGVHITLPFEFEGMEVSNVILSSPRKDLTSLKVEFLG